MQKGTKRGRGRGAATAATAAAAGSGDGAGAAGRGHLTTTVLATPSSGASRHQGLQRIFVGPNTSARAVRPEEVEAVVDYMARSATSSMGFSSTHSTSAESAEPSCSPPFKLPRPSQAPVTQSLLLFDDSCSRDIVAHPPAPAPFKDLGLPDGQDLLWENEDVGSTSLHRLVTDDDDETQVRTDASLCNVEAEREASGEEWVEEDAQGDDEVLDPTWTEAQQSSEEEEVVVVTQPQASSRRGRKVPNPSSQRVATTAHHAQGLSTPRMPHRISPVWHFFKQCAEDKTRVMCMLCQQYLKRGKCANNLSTTCMIRHLQTKHELQWQKHLKTIHKPGSPSATLGVSASTTTSPRRRPPVSPQREDVRPPPSSLPPPPAAVAATPPSPCLSTISQGSVQLSIPQTLDRKRKYSQSHPRALALNACISKLLAFEMLPYRLVETDGFKHLMEVAAPQYSIPSRYYFSRQAIPALHQQVADKIKCALRNAISPSVHITTDTWTSKHGQGRYISLTAHWVNVVAAGTEVGSPLPHILPPPRIAGHQSVPPVASSSYSASSSGSSSCSKRSACTTNLSTAMGKRQQAVLKLICLGERPHTAQELWAGIQEQTDEWLLPLHLKPGKVVCDNGRNLVAALGRAGLTHIPCLAHVLNLVVQSFLAHYPDMSALLQKVRAVCAHFRRSHPAAARLSALQRNFGLPAHRLICDLPTRWNSTLHMLERVCEQQQAIVEFQLQNARVSRSADQQHFTTNDWASMRDICAVLQCFQYATNMVSADDALVSATIPILCLLEKTLQAMTEDVMAEQEEAEEEEEEEGRISQASQCTGGSQGGLLGRQHIGTPLSSQRTVLEDSAEEEEEEEGEEDTLSQQGGPQYSSRASLERGWRGEHEEEEETPATEDSSSLGEGSLSHMSQYMLQCLRNDCRVARIVTSGSYWVATLLDPRYKDNITNLIPVLERDRKMREYKQKLVEGLLSDFPQGFEGTAVARGGGGGGRSRQGGRGTVSTSQGRVSMATMWNNLFHCPPHPPPSETTARSTRRQYLSRMVEDYLSTRLMVLSDGSSPFNFWVSKLDTWPELALYALEVLACPAASVLSERVFSTAGGVITDRRIRLSTLNVDMLTFLKMNKAWIPRDWAVPAPQ